MFLPEPSALFLCYFFQCLILLYKSNIFTTPFSKKVSSLNSNSIGAAIALETNVSYTCETDGYFRTYVGITTSDYVLMYVNNIMVCRYQGNTVQPAYSVFVKKGMRILFVLTGSGGGTFYPIE